MNSHRRRARVAVVERFRLVTQVLDLALSPVCTPVPLPVQDLYSTADVLAAIGRRRFDVVVLGAALGASVDAEQLVEELTAAGCPVVAIADDAFAQARLVRAGAVASPGPDDGLVALRDAVAHAADLRRPPRPPHPPATTPTDTRRLVLQRLGSLTRREVEVFAELVRGRSAAEIARAHVVSELTVRSQVKSILRKLEVGHQLAAVAVARGADWEPPVLEAA